MDSLTKYENAAAVRHEIRALIGGESKVYATIEDKVESLVSEWKDFSSGHYQHAAYLQIIGMGFPVVPLLLKRLSHGDGDWVLALKYIIGAKVTTPSMRGDFSAIQRAWTKWGEANGYGQELQS